jgi:hypothetical protein
MCKVGYVPAEASYANNTDGTATIKFTTGSNLDLTKTYKVKTNSTVSGTKDITGILLAANSVFAAAQNQIAPTVKGVSVREDNKIRVVFDKAMGLVAPSDFRVTVGSSTQTTTGVTPINSTVFDLTLGTAIDVNATPSITTAVNPQSEDTFGAKQGAITNAITADNFKVNTVRLDQGAAVAVAGDETITITFNDSLDADSIKTGWTGAAATTASVFLMIPTRQLHCRVLVY